MGLQRVCADPLQDKKQKSNAFKFTANAKNPQNVKSTAVGSAALGAPQCNDYHRNNDNMENVKHIRREWACPFRHAGLLPAVSSKNGTGRPVPYKIKRYHRKNEAIPNC